MKKTGKGLANIVNSTCARAESSPFFWLQGLCLIVAAILLDKYIVEEGYRSGGAHHTGRGTTGLYAALFMYGGLVFFSSFKFLRNNKALINWLVLPVLLVVALGLQYWYEGVVAR